MAMDMKPYQKPSPDLARTRIAKAIVLAALAMGGIFALYNVLKPSFLDPESAHFSPHKRIDLSESNQSSNFSYPNDRTEMQEFRIAIAPIVSPEKSLEMYDGFVQYVARKLGRKPVSLYRPTYSETNDLVRYKRCDMAIVCTYPFIRGEKEFGMQALVVPQINGETTYQSFVIVPASSHAASIMDLRGKRFASADIISTTGWLFPALLLMGAGEDPNHFFGEHLITGSHDRSLKAVLDGFADGAAVHGIVYQQMLTEDPSILKKIRVLAKSPPFGIPPVVVNPQMDRDLKERVRSVLLEMQQDDEGKQILKKLQIERFIVPDKDLFAPLRLAVSKLENWR
jgi:phosphonate transport system substrate-binding protein